MSSKFSSPFFKKSPLYGAYTSGADAMVTVSTAPHFAKLQSDISGAVDKFYTKKNNKCAKGAEYYFDKDGAKFPCPEKEEETETETTTVDTSETTKTPATVVSSEEVSSIGPNADWMGRRRK